MSGRPVQLLAAAALAVTASFASVSAASANCYSGCGYTTYAAPVAYYQAPVVYSYSYAAPVTYAAPCSPCGYSYGYAARPMYVVNQGPAYTDPVTLPPEPAYNYGYRRSVPYYAGSGVRWNRGYGHRNWGYRAHGAHYGYRHHGHRYGAVVPGGRFVHRGPRFFKGAVPHRHRMGAVVPRHHHMVAPHRMGPKPGAVGPLKRKN